MIDNEIKRDCKRRAYEQEEISEIISFCEQYRQRLIKYCLQYFECEYEYAEDCVQNAYVALIENLQNGIEINNYYAWLYKVTMNYKNSSIKDKIKRKEYDFINNDEKDRAINDSIIYEPDYAENMIDDKIIQERAIAVLSSLNEQEKKLYLLHYIEKKNFKEISIILGITHMAARQRHFELRKKIKNLSANMKKI